MSHVDYECGWDAHSEINELLRDFAQIRFVDAEFLVSDCQHLHTIDIFMCDWNRHTLHQYEGALGIVENLQVTSITLEIQAGMN